MSADACGVSTSTRGHWPKVFLQGWGFWFFLSPPPLFLPVSILSFPASQYWNFFNNKLPSPPPKIKTNYKGHQQSAVFFKVDRCVPHYELEPLEFKVPSLLLPVDWMASGTWACRVGLETSGPPQPLHVWSACLLSVCTPPPSCRKSCCVCHRNEV